MAGKAWPTSHSVYLPSFGLTFSPRISLSGTTGSCPGRFPFRKQTLGCALQVSTAHGDRAGGALDLVDKRITEQAKAKTVDGQVLNWLCAAQERLAEQERILAGRPLPGSRRPGREDRRPRAPFGGPVGEASMREPVPVEPLPG